MFAQDVIIKPVITEKSMTAARDLKKYTFEVADGCDKATIKNAVEELFGVEVKKVNTVSVRGQFRRYGRFSGYRKSWKKAVVTLTDSSKTIDFFDGML